MTTGLFLLLSLIFESCLCHIGLFWPTPRDADLNINTQTAPTSRAPCGSRTFEQGYANGFITDLQAGSTVDIIVYEHIFHSGQPMRFAISGENNEDFESCIWLNHVPYHNYGNGGRRNMTISLTVPDFTCKNCTLQMIVFQTDIQNFETDSSCCAYNSNDTKSCPLQQYYSCANININGGSRSRSDVCVQPDGWANRGLTCNYYRSMTSRNAWEPVEEGNTAGPLRLKTSGTIEGLGFTDDSFCADTNLEIGRSTGCHRTAAAEVELSLVQGGELKADGAIAIVVVILLVTIIVATVCITKKKGIQNPNETSN